MIFGKTEVLQSIIASEMRQEYRGGKIAVNISFLGSSSVGGFTFQSWLLSKVFEGARVSSKGMSLQ